MVEPLVLTPSVDIVTQHPALIRQTAELSRLYKDKEVLVTDEVLQAIGSILWRLLDADEALANAKQRAGQHIVPLLLSSNDAAIQQLPWETIYHPDYGFLARHEGFTFSRTIPSVQKALPDAAKGPLRILLFSSLPDDLTEKEQLQIEVEQAAVLEALGEWRQSGHVVLEMPDDGRFSEFTQVLKSFKPHVVYLSGHGMFQHDALNHTTTGYFFFEDEVSGKSKAFSEAEIAAALTATAVQAVIVSACESGKAASDSLVNGLTYRLLQQGIPHVIGMRESILDRAGIQFAQAFFSALMERHGIAEALQQARNAIVLPLQEDEEFKDTVEASISLGQWCLPMLFSHQYNRALLDWEFTPQPMRAENRRNKSFKQIKSLPNRFIGRRRELRKWQRKFRSGKQNALLLTGAGGIGKTALSYKLIMGLKHDGYEVFCLSFRPEDNWRKYLTSEIPFSLDEHRKNEFKDRIADNSDIVFQAECLFTLLLEQFNGKVAILFDNLESVQDSVTRHLIDAELQQLIDMALALESDGLRMLLTSRYALPHWDNSLVYPLGNPVYRDFLAVAQQQKLPKEFFKDDKGKRTYKRLRQAYEVLGGNFRALEFFAAALQTMNAAEEQDFLNGLKSATEQIQTNMLLEKVWSYRNQEEQELLCALTAYQNAVALDGIKALNLPTMQQSEEFVRALVAVSLVEQYENKVWDVKEEFLVAPLVRDWLQKQGVATLPIELLQRAARYQQWLLENERRTFEQATITHAALMAAGLNDEAHRVTLDWIVTPMNMAGLYQALLDSWLLPACYAVDKQILSETLGQTGKQYHHLAQYSTALDYLKRSLAIVEEIGDKSGEGTTLNNISQIYDARGDYDTALDYLKRSLAIVEEIGDKARVGAALNNISQIFKARGDYDTALDYLKRSLNIRQEIGDKSGEGVTLNNISQIFKAWSDYDTALDYLKRSFAIRQEIGDKKGEGTTLDNIGKIYLAKGDYDTALDYLKRSFTITHEIGDKKGEGTTLNNISQIFQARGDYDIALDYLKCSLVIQQEIGDKSGEGTTLNNISQIYDARGDYDTALDYLKRSLAIQQEIGDKSGEGTTLNNISQIYDARGDYDTALDYLKRSLAIQQEIGDKSGEGTTLNNISQIYDARGDYDTALDYLKRSLAIRQEIGDKSGEGTTLNNISALYHARGDYDTALDYLKRSLAIAQEIGDKSGEGTTLNNISALYHARGDYDTALDYLKRSLAIRQEIGDVAGLCATLINMGHIYLQNNEIQDAVSAWVTAYTLARKIGYAQALDALENLAQQLGLPNGLAGWEMLARQMGEVNSFNRE
uniref:TPR repeat n=1 Tax=Chlorobium chlorochromatii (strain CaD3) TaxID=340177 RepID=Q3AQG5_CHLCH